MNKVILMGRLTRDPEMRYTQAAEPLAIANFSLAVDKRYKRDGESSADFINCVAFGRGAEFIEKYFQKGQLVSVVGRLQVRTYDDKDGNKKWVTEVVVEEQFFAESKKSFEDKKNSSSSNNYDNQYNQQPSAPSKNDGFVAIDEDVDDDDLPF